MGAKLACPLHYSLTSAWAISLQRRHADWACLISTFGLPLAISPQELVCRSDMCLGAQSAIPAIVPWTCGTFHHSPCNRGTGLPSAVCWCMGMRNYHSSLCLRDVLAAPGAQIAAMRHLHKKIAQIATHASTCKQGPPYNPFNVRDKASCLFTLQTMRPVRISRSNSQPLTLTRSFGMEHTTAPDWQLCVCSQPCSKHIDADITSACQGMYPSLNR